MIVIKLRTYIIAISVGLLHAAALQAAVVYDNLGSGPTYYQDGYASFGLIDGNSIDRGMKFVASQTVSLTTLQVAIGQAYWDGSTYAGSASIQLFTDAGNSPGTLLESWTSSYQSSFAGGVETLTSTAQPLLTKGSSYWIMMNDAPNSYLGGAWYFADSPQPGYVWVSYRPAAGQPLQVYQLTTGYRTRVIGNLPGDANGDGVVNADDYALIDRGYAAHLSGWSNGDFNGDNVVNFSDYLIIDEAYAAAQGGVPTDLLAQREGEFGANYANALVTAVPEPGIATALVAISAFFARRKR